MEFQTSLAEAGTHSAAHRTLIPYILYKYSCDNFTWTAADSYEGGTRKSVLHVDASERRCWQVDTTSHPGRLESTAAPMLERQIVKWYPCWCCFVRHYLARSLTQPSCILSYCRRPKWQQETGSCHIYSINMNICKNRSIVNCVGILIFCWPCSSIYLS